jgi:hypothetical protein
VTCERCGYNKRDRDYLHVCCDTTMDGTVIYEWVCGLCFYAKVHGFPVEPIGQGEKRGPKT